MIDLKMKFCCLVLFVAAVSIAQAAEIREFGTMEEFGYDGRLAWDAYTGLYWPPTFSELPTQDKRDEKIRELSVSSKFADKYCKVNVYEYYSFFFSANYWEPHWCMRTNEEGKRVNACCGDNHCGCNSFGMQCWCWKNHPGPHDKFTKIKMKG